MNELHTIPATLYFGEREFEVMLIVDANYDKGWPGTRLDPPDPEGYEVWNIQLAEPPQALLSAMGDHLLICRSEERAAAAEADADARREYDILRRTTPELAAAHDGLMGLGEGGAA